MKNGRTQAQDLLELQQNSCCHPSTPDYGQMQWKRHPLHRKRLLPEEHSKLSHQKQGLKVRLDRRECQVRFDRLDSQGSQGNHGNQVRQGRLDQVEEMVAPEDG